MLVPILPTELITEIFLRLPLQSLLRFRCVSKDLCRVIDGEHFTNMHLTKGKRNPLLIVHSIYKLCVYSIDSKSLVELDVYSWSHKDYFYNAKLWGSCNGLLCFYCVSNNVIMVCNPSTKKRMILPAFCLFNYPYVKSRYNMALGFGFDSVTGDYKVVSILQHYTNTHNNRLLLETEVMVCSLRSKLWRRVSGFGKGFCHTGCKGVLVGESLYWPVNLEGSIDCSSIVAFDLKTDEFNLLSLPSRTTAWHSPFITFLVIEGCLSMSFFNSYELELWIMDECGAEQSWNKLISIPMFPNLKGYSHFSPVQYSKDVGMLLVACSYHFHMKVIWFDFQTQTFEEIQIHGLPPFFGSSFMFLSESLVRLDGGGHLKDRIDVSIEKNGAHDS